MSTILQIELTDDEAARLVQNARARGTGVEDLVRGMIAGLPDADAGATNGTTPGAQLLGQLKADGALGIWKDRADSPELAREFRRRAEARGGTQ